MSIESKVKSILKSAELSFELGIINPTRYGPLIHANVPDYVEIILKLYLEEKKVKPSENNFWGVSDSVEANLPVASRSDYSPLGEYFKQIRKDFRNPLHHTDKVQGYVIEQREALLCLVRFDDLINVVFPTVGANESDDLNYPCYINYIRMFYDDSLGRGNFRLFQAINNELNKLQLENTFDCPPDFNVGKLIAIRRLFRYSPEIFARQVMGYRFILEERVLTFLENTNGPKTPRQILLALKQGLDLSDLDTHEIESCLRHISGRHFQGKGTIIEVGGFGTFQPRYYLEQ